MREEIGSDDLELPVGYYSDIDDDLDDDNDNLGPVLLFVIIATLAIVFKVFIVDKTQPTMDKDQCNVQVESKRKV